METISISHETFRNESTIVSNHRVAFDHQGKATVPLAIAGDAVGIPGFIIPENVPKTLARIEREESEAVVGPYDAGRLVLLHNADHKGIAATDCDNQTVKFDKAGYVQCGERTALNLRARNVVPPAPKEGDPDPGSIIGRLTAPLPAHFVITELDGSPYIEAGQEKPKAKAAPEAKAPEAPKKKSGPAPGFKARRAEAEAATKPAAPIEAQPPTQEETHVTQESVGQENSAVS